MPPTSRVIKVGTAALTLLTALLCVNARAIESSLADDIKHLSELTGLTVEIFNQRTEGIRMGMEFTDDFTCPADRQFLHKTAAKTAAQLKSAADLQQQLEIAIEDYKGDDWDARFGSTGLWRRLHGDIYSTRLGCCRTEFFAAISAELNGVEPALRKLLDDVDKLAATAKSPILELLRARTLAALGRGDLSCRISAAKVFQELADSNDLPEATALRAEVDRIRFLGQSDANDIDNLVEKLATSKAAEDLHLAMSVAALQRRFGSPADFERTVNRFSQIARSVESVMLIDLTNRLEAGSLDTGRTPLFEAQLAARAALAGDARGHEALLSRLAGDEKLACPIVLYAAAVAGSESSPDAAVGLLTKAAAMEAQQPSKMLTVDANEISAQAAKLAYNLFAAQTWTAEKTLETFDSYFAADPNPVDPQVQYLYAVVLRRAGSVEDADRVLGVVASNAAGKWRNRAELDLIKLAIAAGKGGDTPENSPRRRLETLLESIRPASVSDPLYFDAIVTYCNLLLDGGTLAEARTALDTLDGIRKLDDARLITLKARALKTLGDIETQMSFLRIACQSERAACFDEALAALAELSEELDHLQATHPRFDDILTNAVDLAEYCSQKLTGQQHVQATLELAELYTFKAAKEPYYIDRASKLLAELDTPAEPTTDLLRCRARLLTESGKFSEAAEQWAKLADAHKLHDGLLAKPSPRWWRARFFELYCLSRCPHPPVDRIAHTIDVLESSFQDIPLTWASRLTSLKKHCSVANT